MSAVLGSWKEIAVFMGKGVRTVQRWERSLGLPVHRQANGTREAVMAFPAELQHWAVHSGVTGAAGERQLPLQCRRISEQSASLVQQTIRLITTTEALMKRCQAAIALQQKRQLESLVASNRQVAEAPPAQLTMRQAS